MSFPNFPIQKAVIGNKNYPRILNEIKNCPKILYYRGKMDENLFKKSLAVVGTRRITHYGKMVIEKIIPHLISNQVTIISGFMYGVDTEAHLKCLEYGGKTVAVLGCGLNIIYPPENEKLYQKILEKGGLIVSEYEPNLKPQLWTFPQRNRIIAGLSSLGVLIIEAGEKSGALITAHYARSQRKRVFAVPGPITSETSMGSNFLIKTNQAKMVLGAEDILGGKGETPFLFPSLELEHEEKEIFEALKNEPLTADEIAKVIKKDIAETGKNLSLMSLKGIITEYGGKYFLNLK